jgi:hypothetical protein
MAEKDNVVSIYAAARKVGPDTSKKAAAKVTTFGWDDIFERFEKHGTLTCEELLLDLRKDMDPGQYLRESSVSSNLNHMMMAGLLVIIDETRKNTSGRQAQVWRIATIPESDYLIEYVGKKAIPWPSGDTVLKAILRAPAIRAFIERNVNIDVLRLIRRYEKGQPFRTYLRDHGITKMMQKYDTNGKPRAGNDDEG